MKDIHADFTLDIKSLEESGLFSGYASVFDIVDDQKDVIVRGAFKNTLMTKGNSIKLLWQHKSEEPIGTFTKIYEDSHGLFVEGKLLLDVARAKEAYALLKEGVLNGLSIGYKAQKYSLDHDSGVRYLTEIDLFEISLVTFPANKRAAVRLVKQETPQTVREFEQFLRDAGFSRSTAKSIALKGFSHQRDAGGVDFVGLNHALDRAIFTLIT